MTSHSMVKERIDSMMPPKLKTYLTERDIDGLELLLQAADQYQIALKNETQHPRDRTRSNPAPRQNNTKYQGLPAPSQAKCAGPPPLLHQTYGNSTRYFTHPPPRQCQPQAPRPHQPYEDTNRHPYLKACMLCSIQTTQQEPRLKS
jgi:hypothetical protein